uniref:Uncharacterized protein n=1 Tax=Octopus bimaculoides TaxID=37653 RepID=A0A0L8HK75_OCTBM
MRTYGCEREHGTFCLPTSPPPSVSAGLFLGVATGLWFGVAAGLTINLPSFTSLETSIISLFLTCS